jgi:hypothetical protein
MTVKRYLFSGLLVCMLSIGCRRSSQTWSKCTHDKPIIKVELVWQERGPYSYPRGTSTHILRLEDTIKNASLDIKHSYLNKDGDSTFSTSRCKGHVVATYYCEEIDVDHRLALEFVRTTKGRGIRRAIYFLHLHEPPEPAWDCECDPPKEVDYFDHCMAPGPNLTLEFSVKSLAGETSLVMKITTPREAVPLCMR